jgi:hypothetical protein
VRVHFLTGRFVIARGFVGGALALAAGAILTLLLATLLQDRAEYRNDRAGARPLSTGSPFPSARPPD